MLDPDATSSENSVPTPPVLFQSYRNTVPVPTHWCQERRFADDRRPYELPASIAATGIQDCRRDGTRWEWPDYEVLYDAFFKHQTKPRLRVPGDVYCEGGEVMVSEVKTTVKVQNSGEAVGVIEDEEGAGDKGRHWGDLVVVEEE